MMIEIVRRLQKTVEKSRYLVLDAMAKGLGVYGRELMLHDLSLLDVIGVNRQERD